MTDSTFSATRGDAQAIITAMKDLPGVEIETLSDPARLAPDVPVLVTPRGREVMGLKPFIDPFRTRPERREGMATLLDLTSLIDHVNRFKDDDSVVFANNRWRQPTPQEAARAEERNDPNGGWHTPSLTAVLDYHEALTLIDLQGEIVREVGAATALPRFGRHRAHYAFPLAPEFMAWMSQNGQAMTQADFAVFLEERALDIDPPPINDGWFTGQAPAPGDDASPEERKRFEFMDLLRTMTARLKGEWAGPEKMMDLSRGLKVNEANKVEGKTNVSSGTGALVFVNEHTDEVGEPLKVPNLFLISIPVFKNGPRYLIPVRLRYRLQSGRVIWFYDTYRHDRVFDHAFDEAISRVQGETGLRVLVGQPET